MQNEYQHILSKIDAFIRRYYLNQLIRGCLIALGLFVSLFLIINLLEYFGRFSSSIRFSLFTIYLLTTGFTSYKLIITPLVKLYRLGKVISHEEAAVIIGKHFTQVADKILNILQLKKENDCDDISLIEAAINQKSAELRPVQFISAVNLSENKRYAKYALLPLIIFICLFIVYPHLITQSTTRLINYNQEFIPEAPFKFKLKNKSLNVLQHQDFTIEVEIKGDEIPAEAYINYKGFEYKMQKIKNGLFEYTLNNIQKSTSFNFIAAGFNSENFSLTVLPKPIIASLQINIDYPAYISRKDEIITNTGDLTVPEGTVIKWKLRTENIKELVFKSDLNAKDSESNFLHEEENMFSISKRINNSLNYSFISRPYKNEEAIYSINVIKDSYPEITVEAKKDSLSNRRYYFNGLIKDDYGFSKLNFNYRFVNKKTDSTGKVLSNYVSVNIPIIQNQLQNNFFHYFDLNTLNLNADDEVEYFFEIYDNDGINGPKSSRSQHFNYKAPSLSELSKQKNEANKEIKNDLKEAIDKAKKLQKEIKAVEKKVNDKKQLNWEEKKQIEELIKQQQDLQKSIENISEQNEKNNQINNENTQPSEELLEKQKQLEELFEKVMNEDMKKMYEELQQLLEKMDKTQTQDALDKLKMDNKDLEKELDRNLELFKQLEFEQKLTETTERLKDLAQKQEDLSKETQNDKNNSADKQKELGDKQDKLNKEFEDLKKEYKDLEQKNKELQDPHDLKELDKKQEDIKKDMQNSSEELKQKKNKKASQSQKQAAEKMEEMAKEMEKMSDEMQEEEAGEDYDALRQILENLVQLSFNQEILINEVKTADINNPKFLKIGQNQRKLKDDAKLIEDSLFALSKRNPQISSVVNKEISAIHHNIEKALDNLQERQLSQAASRQQFTMTSINNLALILSESLQQMQQQMKQQQQSKSKPGQGSCKKPGNGNKPSMQSMRQMQQQLNEQLKRMKEGMDKQGQKPGQKPGQGNNTMSKEFAQMAAQQEALRQAMQKAMQEMNGGKEGSNKDGGSNGNAKELRELAKKMEQTEQDLVNKNITPETLKRQQDILTRLLEAEKAEREREQDEKRKSNEAKNENYSNNSSFLEYKRIKKQETELLKTVSPALKPYYKEKVNEYFNIINGLK